MSDRKKEVVCWIVAILSGMGVVRFQSSSLVWIFAIPFVVALLGAMFFDLKSRFTSFFSRFRR